MNRISSQIDFMNWSKSVQVGRTRFFWKSRRNFAQICLALFYHFFWSSIDSSPVWYRIDKTSPETGSPKRTNRASSLTDRFLTSLMRGLLKQIQQLPGLPKYLLRHWPLSARWICPRINDPHCSPEDSLSICRFEYITRRDKLYISR